MLNFSLPSLLANRYFWRISCVLLWIPFSNTNNCNSSLHCSFSGFLRPDSHSITFGSTWRKYLYENRYRFTFTSPSTSIMCSIMFLSKPVEREPDARGTLMGRSKLWKRYFSRIIFWINFPNNMNWGILENKQSQVDNRGHNPLNKTLPRLE